ncbi:MAG TPA: dienelactone hydrolase family protein [Propionibacteriaceae bacterium]
METISRDIRIEDRLVVTARPAGAGRWPGVVMIHEIFGIDDVLRVQAERLASAGYVVYAPDLLGAGLKVRCIKALFGSLTARTGRPFELIETTRQQVLADPNTTDKVGVIGFCMGGGFALVLAARGFDASSVNYGMVPEELDEVLEGACPIVASYGARDAMLAKEVPRLAGALAKHQIVNDVKLYPTAGHSFLNHAPNGPRPLRPLMKIAHAGPDPVAAANAWRRIESFFAAHLG